MTTPPSYEPATTAGEADANSAARAATFQRRLNTLAVFVLAALLVLSVVIQVQVQAGQRATYEMCQQRAANAVRANQLYVDLENIETHNTFIDASIRKQRVAAYRAAHLTVPTCKP